MNFETDAKGGSWSTYERVLPWLVRWACCADTIDFCPALAALVSPVQILFSHRTLFHFMCPSRPASWAGSRAGRLSLNMCLWSMA
jgi:hypothetical protein